MTYFMNAQQKPMPQRYYSLDSMRFICSFTIALAHFSMFADDPLTRWLGGIYPIVDYFFLLSGFVIMFAYHKVIYSFGDYAAFLKARLARIYPLHISIFAIYLVLGVLNWTGIARAADQTKYDPSAIIPNILLVHAWGTTKSLSFNFPSWSVSAEWFVYLLFPLALWLARRGGYRAIGAAAICIILALNAAERAGWLPDWTGATNDGGALRAVPSFLLGLGAFVYLEKTRFSLSTYWPALIAFGVGVGTMLVRLDPLVSLMFAVIAITLFGAAEIGMAKGFLRNPKLVALGDASYAIYMIHPLVGTLLITGVGKRLLGLTGMPLLIWGMVVGGAITLLVAPLVYAKLERPARKYINSLNVLRGTGARDVRPNVPVETKQPQGTVFAESKSV